MQFKAGDLIGFSGANWQSDCINLATYGVPRHSLSHVAIVSADWHDRQLLFESTTLTNLPCVFRGEPFKGSQAHGIQERIDSYDGRVWVYPLYRSLFPHEFARLRRYLTSTLGVPYDTNTALRAGGLGFSALASWLHPESRAALFCSDWCAAAHSAIGVFPTTVAARWSPNHLVRAERAAGLLKPPERIK